jgi:hypothetical protein
MDDVASYIDLPGVDRVEVTREVAIDGRMFRLHATGAAGDRVAIELTAEDEATRDNGVVVRGEVLVTDLAPIGLTRCVD